MLRRQRPGRSEYDRQGVAAAEVAVAAAVAVAVAVVMAVEAEAAANGVAVSARQTAVAVARTGAAVEIMTSAKRAERGGRTAEEDAAMQRPRTAGGW